MLRIGLQVTADTPSSRALRLGVAAEEAGLDSVWVVEDPFYRGALPTLGALAASTARIRLGLGVVNPWSRHVSLMAMDIIALCELAPGRIAWGLGTSGRAQVEAMGMAFERPVTRLRDTIRALRLMLAPAAEPMRETAVARLGPWAVPRLDAPAPAALPPIMVAGIGERAVEMAGECGDGWLVSSLCPPAYVAERLSVLDAGARQSGRRAAELEVVHYVTAFIGEDDAAQRMLARQHLTAVFPAYAAFFAGVPSAWEPVRRSSGIEPDAFDQLLEALRRGADANIIPDVVVDSFVVSGTPDRCARLLQRYGEAGTTEVVLAVPGDPGDGSTLVGIAALRRVAGL